MKNIFGINCSKMIPQDKREIDGKAYRTQKLPSENARELEDMQDRGEALEKKAKLPLWMTIVMYIGFIFFVCCVGGIGENIGEISLSQMYSNAPWAFWGGGAALLVSLGLFVYGRKRSKSVGESAVAAEFVQDANEVMEKAKEALQIPEDAKEMDVFLFPYRVKKNGKAVQASFGAKFINKELYVYRKGDFLCFTSLEEEVSIPITSFIAIYRINKSAVFSGWNKTEPFRSPKYKPYKVRMNNYGMFFVKPHYSIRISGSEGDFEILIPSYELETIQSFINCSVF